MDIYFVPYNDGQGGPATPFPGASDPAVREFYPVFAPGDAVLAFNRTTQEVDSYDEPTAEVYVVPIGSSSPVRLSANDPPACTGLVSPGLTNSWARWAPTASEYDGKKYYWLVFSSKRRTQNGLLPQLYISAVVTTVGAGGNEVVEEEYPALYITSQDSMGNNHTPAWDNFEVPDDPPQ
jgi:hypothetical protein